MFRATVLGSGSRGNAILLEGPETTVLIDAGFAPRTLARRLACIGRRPEHIQALLLTHEHVDHAQGALACCALWKWPLLATAGTLDGMPESVVPTITVQTNSGFAVGGLSVVAAPIPHDAREPVALVFTDRASGCRAGIAMDLGHIPETLPPVFEKLDLLVIESNHDAQMLAQGPYPWMLKRRIGGNDGHLSNQQAASFASLCAHSRLGAVVLAHLSQTNNSPQVAVECTTRALRKAGWTRDRVWAAHQTEVRGPYVPIGSVQSTHAMQLGLSL